MRNHERLRSPGLIAALLLAASAPALSQSVGGAAADSVSVVPGPDYAAGSFHRFFWGDHYRDVWTTEIRVPVLDLLRLLIATFDMLVAMLARLLVGVDFGGGRLLVCCFRHGAGSCG